MLLVISEERAYNLHSGGSEAATLPVQFEVSDDRFMSELLQYQQSTSKSGQVSDSDCKSEHNSLANVESDTEQTAGSESTVVDLFIWGFTSLSTLYRSSHVG